MIKNMYSKIHFCMQIKKQNRKARKKLYVKSIRYKSKKM